MAPWRFIHAADLHLGATIRLPSGEATPIDASRQAATRIAAYCQEQAAAFLLLSGDTFEYPNPDLDTVLFFCELVAQLSRSGVGVYLVTGNHDYAALGQAGLPLPKNLHIFAAGSPSTCYPKAPHPVAITGVSFGQRHVRTNLAPQIRAAVPNSDGYHIAILHANLGGNGEHGNYAPCKLSDLRDPKIHYWALGHIHQHQEFRTGPTIVAYPGCSQGRNRRERGQRGCLLVEVDENHNSSCSLLPTAYLRWESLQLDLSCFAQLDQLQAAVQIACREYWSAGVQGLMLAVELVGHSEWFLELATDLEEIRSYLNRGLAADQIYLHSLESRLQVALDIAAEEETDNLLGCCLRIASQMLENPELARQALSPLYQNSTIGADLTPLTDSELAAAVKRAKQQIASKLQG